MMRVGLAAFVSAVMATGCVQAESDQQLSFNGIAASRTVDTDGNVEMNGAALSLEGRVGGWVDMNGASIDIDARIGGRLDANGASIEFTGHVGGASEINGGAVDLDGVFIGPMELNAGSARLEGRFANEVRINAASVDLHGDHAAPIMISGQGRDRNWLGRPRTDRSEIELAGHLAAGGRVCAHEVTFKPQFSLGGILYIIADERPDTPSGIDPNFIEFEARNGERCDSV